MSISIKVLAFSFLTLSCFGPSQNKTKPGIEGKWKFVGKIIEKEGVEKFYDHKFSWVMVEEFMVDQNFKRTTDGEEVVGGTYNVKNDSIFFEFDKPYIRGQNKLNVKYEIVGDTLKYDSKVFVRI